MNKLYTMQLVCLALLVTGKVNADNVQVESKEKQPVSQEMPKRGFWFDDYFRDMEEHFEKMRTMQHKMFEEFYNQQDRSSQAFSKLPNVITNITDDADNVIIKITVGEKGTLILDPKDVDISSQENRLNGTVNIPHGKIEFVLAHNTFQVVKNAEITEEIKKDDKVESKIVGYSSSSQAQSIPALVDISKVNAEVNSNELILSINKKKQSKITVKVAQA